MDKNTSLTALGLAILPFSAAEAQKPEKNAADQDQRPNIVHIMTDDHSFQTISAYGHPISQLAPTPNIDRLARNGMIFTRAYVENSLSAPSRACLLTGLYSHQNGQRQLIGGIDSTKTFFPELLQANGYQTAVVGKWHLECEPKGFDYYKVLYRQGTYYKPEFKSPDSDGKYISEPGYTTDIITDHSIEFLETRDKSKPFCLLVHHKAPHRNWMPAIKYLNLYEDVTFPIPETFYDDYTTRGSAAGTQEMTIAKHMNYPMDLKVPMTEKAFENLTSRLTPKEKKAWKEFYDEHNKPVLNGELSGKELAEWKYQRYIKDYVRCIKSVDDNVGRLLDYLEKEGLMDNTIIVYTSDQGFYMGEHGWFDKRFMYEESFRTPLIICYPKMIKPGTVCDELVQNIDYAPTYLDIAGLNRGRDMVGRSIKPLLKGEKPVNWREYLYYHYYDYPAIHMVRRQDGVADKRYKLIHFYGKGAKGNPDIDYEELYDLEKDPNELHNVYGQPVYKEVVKRLQKQLEKFRKELKIDEY